MRKTKINGVASAKPKVGVKKFEDVFSRFDRITAYADGQTDFCRRIVRALRIASRGNNVAPKLGVPAISYFCLNCSPVITDTAVKVDNKFRYC